MKRTVTMVAAIVATMGGVSLGITADSADHRVSVREVMISAIAPATDTLWGADDPQTDEAWKALEEAAIVVIAAFAAAGISMVERWLSSRIGEGIIYDLRDRLFRHVQAMPLGFFTQTQTGALISRLNNDVIGAQRAFTTFLSTVIGNVINLLITLVTMFYIEWRLTLLSLVILPFFIIPSRRVGARMADITRESMELNASMNTTMTERFNVSGAMLVKLFGRPGVEADEFATRAARMRDIGVRSALYARTFMVAMTLVGALGIAIAGRFNDNLRETVTLVTAGALAWAVWSLVPELMDGGRPELSLLEIVPGIEVAFRIEPLGMLFAALASGLWIVNSVYSIGYMRGNNEKNQTRFYVFFAISLFATMGIAFAANLFTLFLFYEALTLSTYPLVSHKGDRDTVR